MSCEISQPNLSTGKMFQVSIVGWLVCKMSNAVLVKSVFYGAVINWTASKRAFKLCCQVVCGMDGLLRAMGQISTSSYVAVVFVFHYLLSLTDCIHCISQKT